jgi:hypothetical protein
MKPSRQLLVIALVLGTALVTTLITSAVGAGDRSALDDVSASKGAVKVKVAHSLGGDTTNTNFAQMPGMTATVTVPENQTHVLIVHLSAESTCNFGGAGSACQGRILNNGTILASLFYFDTDDTGDNYFEGHAVTRHTPRLGPGTYTITAEWRVLRAPQTTGTLFRVREPHLVVESWRV